MLPATSGAHESAASSSSTTRARNVAAGSRRLAGDKVSLVAVVHHKSVSSLGVGDGGDSGDDCGPKGDLNRLGERRAPEQQRVGGSTSNENKKIFKLSQLFARKRRRRKSIGGNECEISKSQGNSATREEDAFARVAGESGSSESSETISCKIDGKSNSRMQQTHQKLNQNSGHLIEFKFDLIIDKQTQPETREKTPDARQEKLQANLDDLVESFVLDSNDVCLMTIGKEHLNSGQLSANYSPICGDDVGNKRNVMQQEIQDCDDDKKSNCQRNEKLKDHEFECLNQLAENTLAYAFELLDSKHQQLQQQEKQHSSYDCRRCCLSSGSTGSTGGGGGGGGGGDSFRRNGQEEHPADTQSVWLASSSSVDGTESAGDPLRGVGVASDLNVRGEHGNGNCCKCPMRKNYSIEITATLLVSSGDESSPCDCSSTNTTSKVVAPAAGVSPPTRLQSATPVDDLTEYGFLGCCGLCIVDILKETTEADSAAGFRVGGEKVTDQAKLHPTCGSSSMLTVDCANIGQAKAVMRKIRHKLTSNSNSNPISSHTIGATERGNKLLIIGLKLKRRINGGLFSNRMCLIDFDPNFLELQSIFSSIFNGQALAHLKRRKLHLQTLEEWTPRWDLGQTMDESMGKEKHLHQVASLNKLIQAEWLLYKQLSSALIKTLIVVHVHKLDDTLLKSTNGSNIKDGLASDRHTRVFKQAEYRLMANNLTLLEFARIMQRASMSRLRRRKRNLKSRFASSNVSVASNGSADSTTVNHHRDYDMADDLTLLRAPPAHLYRRATSPHMRQASQRTHRGFRKASMEAELSLMRCKRRTSSCGRSHHSRYHHCQHSKAGTRSSSRSSYWSPNIDSPTSPKHRHDSVVTKLHQQSARNNWQQSDLTESSSMSSGGFGGQSMRFRASTADRNRPLCQNAAVLSGDNSSNSYLNNYSDSDSIASANLNDRSTSSAFSRLLQLNRQNHSSSLRVLGGQSKRRSSKESDDIEMGWLGKQQSAAARMMIMMQNRQQLPGHLATDQSLRSQANASKPRAQVGPLQSNTFIPPAIAVVESKVTSPKDPSVIQIDCYQHSTADQVRSCSSNVDPITVAASEMQMPLLASSLLSRQFSDETVLDDRAKLEDNPDNISDICSVVAEPPKQLKLEQFLKQLSGAVGPMTKDGTRASSQHLDRQKSTELLLMDSLDHKSTPRNFSSITSLTRGQVGDEKHPQQDRRETASRFERNSNLQPDEDDDDCKSHSSILEHLSSLALESNSKFNNRQMGDVIFQHPLERCLSGDYLARNMEVTSHKRAARCDSYGPTNEPSSDPLDKADIRSNTNSGLRVAIKNPQCSIEERLRALTIDCQAQSGLPVSRSSAFISSNESSCSPTTSSSSSSSGAKDNDNNKTKRNNGANSISLLAGMPKNNVKI